MLPNFTLIQLKSLQKARDERKRAKRASYKPANWFSCRNGSDYREKYRRSFKGFMASRGPSGKKGSRQIVKHTKSDQVKVETIAFICKESKKLQQFKCFAERDLDISIDLQKLVILRILTMTWTLTKSRSSQRSTCARTSYARQSKNNARSRSK